VTKQSEVDRLAEPQEVADFLRVDRKLLYDWRYRGIGPRALRVGGHLRYRWSEVERWLDEQS
jgi:predicted DNA-binding transcriptional regulator AlpA